MLPQPNAHDSMNFEAVQFEELGRAPISVSSSEAHEQPVEKSNPPCAGRCPTENRELLRNQFPTV